MFSEGGGAARMEEDFVADPAHPGLEVRVLQAQYLQTELSLSWWQFLPQ